MASRNFTTTLLCQRGWSHHRPQTLHFNMEKNSWWRTATSTNTSSQGTKTTFTITYNPWNEITTGHSFLNSDIRVSIKSSNKQHNPASHKRQLSATIKLAISVDDALNEVMKIIAERWPEDVSCSYQPNLFTCSVFVKLVKISSGPSGQ